jgi:O-antigen/teichoic acid export membrane protein
MSRTILKNTAWGVFGEIITRLSKMLLVVLMARYLGAAEIGRYNVALAQASMFLVFFDFGVMSIAVRELARNPSPVTYFLYLSVKLLGTLSGIAAVALATTALDMPDEERLLLLGLGLYLALNDLSTFVFAVYRARSEFWRETLLRTLFSVMQLAASVMALLLGYEVGGVVVALALSAAIGLGPLIAETLKQGPRAMLDMQSASAFVQAIRQCLPLAGMVLMGTLYTNLDILVLGGYATAEEIGWYSVATKIIFGLLIMPVHYFQLATLPVFSAQLADGSLSQMRQHWMRGFVLSTTAGAILILITANSSGWLVSLLFGAEFAPAAPILEIYALIGFLFYLYIPLSQLLLVMERQHLTFYIQILTLAVNAVSIFLFIPAFGIWGAVLAGGITHATMALLHFLFVWKTGGFTGDAEGRWAIFRVSVGLIAAVCIIRLGDDPAWSWLASTALFLTCAHRETFVLAQHFYSRTLGRPVF